MTAPFVISDDFKDFIFEILQFRCRLKPATISKYFDTPHAWQLMRQAFIHKSVGTSNYELFEFEGDVALNFAVVEHIRLRFPRIVNVKWLTRIKHNLISKKTLAEIALGSGFKGRVDYGDKMARIFAQFTDPTDCRDYMSMYEDTVESLCGVINHILNMHLMRGVGYAAVYNLVDNFLSNMEIPIVYEVVFDAKSRLKELFDAQGWDKIRGCALSNCLVVLDFTSEQPTNPRLGLRTYRDTALARYKRDVSGPLDEVVLRSTDRYLALGYACVHRSPESKTLLAAVTANDKSSAEQRAAKIVIYRLARMGISIIPPDPYAKNT